jgi:hypothetical protein
MKFYQPVSLTRRRKPMPCADAQLQAKAHMWSYIRDYAAADNMLILRDHPSLMFRHPTQVRTLMALHGPNGDYTYMEAAERMHSVEDVCVPDTPVVHLAFREYECYRLLLSRDMRSSAKTIVDFMFKFVSEMRRRLRRQAGVQTARLPAYLHISTFELVPLTIATNFDKFVVRFGAYLMQGPPEGDEYFR